MDSRRPKALMFHAIYRNPGGEEQSFANESKLLKSIGYETVQCPTENSKISRGPWAAVTAVFSPRVLVDALRIIRSERPDVIYVNNLWPAFLGLRCSWPQEPPQFLRCRRFGTIASPHRQPSCAQMARAPNAVPPNTSRVVSATDATETADCRALSAT